MITDNSIKMYAQAEEIQEIRPNALNETHLKGNVFICVDKYSANYFWIMNKFADVGDEVGSSIHISTKYIWLPTQEQLQEMIIPILRRKFKDFWDMERINIWMIQHFINFMHDIDYLDTLNEFWLAFVMKEKYHKIWTGEKWVKADD